MTEIGQNHAPKVYELVEKQTEEPATKAANTRPYLGINGTGITLRNNDRELCLSTEIFSTATLLAAYIDLGEVLHRRLRDVFLREIERDADSGAVRPAGLGGR